MWKPVTAASIIFAVSIGCAAFGWHIYASHTAPRTELEVGYIVVSWVIGLMLFVGSAGYLAASPGLELGPKGSRPKKSAYGKFVAELIGKSKSSCGAGYSFGISVCALCFGLTIALVLAYLFFSGASELWASVKESPRDTLQNAGIVIGCVMAILTLVYGIPKGVMWLKSRELFLAVCPPRQFPRKRKA